jgi:hypothetical protein
MRRALAILPVLAFAAACGAPTESPATFPSTTASTTAASSAAGGSGSAAPDRNAAEDVAQRFAEAANSGDERAVAALFAPDARFDSVGRIYPSRADIMDRFLVPEVLDVRGRYQPGERRWDGDRLVVTYDFTTDSGGRERFTYAYLIHDGLIRDVVGRYV